jgi:uncharacterized protein
MKTYIIDGTNILHKDSDLRLKMRKNYEIACNSLLNKIKSYHYNYQTFKFYLFFDGAIDTKIESIPAIAIKFSIDDSADNLIKQFIKSLNNRKNISVVSSDTEIINYAHIHSIDAISSEDFLKIIEPKSLSINQKHSKYSKSEKPNGCGRKQIKEFLDLFNNSDD